MVRQAGVGITREGPGDENDGQVGPEALVRFASGVPGETAGQIDVKEDQINRMAAQEIEAGQGVGSSQTLVIVRGKRLAQGIGHGRIILDDQDNHPGLLRRRPGALSICPASADASGP